MSQSFFFMELFSSKKVLLPSTEAVFLLVKTIIWAYVVLSVKRIFFK